MINKIKNKIEGLPWRSLGELRNVGFLVFLIIVLLMTWSGIKAVQSNYRLQKQVSDLQQQNQLQQLENANIQLQNEYYSSNQYLAISARQNLGLGNPGETELIVPKSVALAHLPKSLANTGSDTKPANHEAWYARNFKAWVNFYFRHNAGN